MLVSLRPSSSSSARPRRTSHHRYCTNLDQTLAKCGGCHSHWPMLLESECANISQYQQITGSKSPWNPCGFPIGRCRRDLVAQLNSNELLNLKQTINFCKSATNSTSLKRQADGPGVPVVFSLQSPQSGVQIPHLKARQSSQSPSTTFSSAFLARAKSMSQQPTNYNSSQECSYRNKAKCRK